MNAIGGYFGLELHEGRQRYHETPYTFRSGRAALHAILLHLKPACVYVPFYTCDALMESFEAAGCPYHFYAVDDQLRPEALPSLQSNEYFLYINYFDCCGDTVRALSDRYGAQLITDCTQAFFRKGNGRSWFFNSCRKFFGVPDGSYVYTPENAYLPQPESSNESFLVDHLLHRFNGHPRKGYAAFKVNESLCGPEIKAMSKLTKSLLSHVPYSDIVNQRRNKFLYLHEALCGVNFLSLYLDADAVPMCYPLLPARPLDHAALAAKGIFVPRFWPELTNRQVEGYKREQQLAAYLLPLPVDHRYGEKDMHFIIHTIKNLL
jgi:Predicted ATPase/kinase involved in NAD metabolism